MSGDTPALVAATLGVADAPAYRALMLEAYEQAADAFTSTAEERAGLPLAWWENRIAGAAGLSQCFGVFLERQLVGAVALEWSGKPKTKHSGQVVGMYVQPATRRCGAGALLMRTLLAAARARPQARLLRLTVTAGNDSAQRLYEAAGFRAWGIEPEVILTPSGYRDKVHLCLRLRPESSDPTTSR